MVAIRIPGPQSPVRENSARAVRHFPVGRSLGEGAESHFTGGRSVVCAENEKDHRHLVGTASDDRKRAIRLPQATLAAYVGQYELAGTQLPPILRTIVVTLRDEELLADFGDKNFTPIYAQT